MHLNSRWPEATRSCGTWWKCAQHSDHFMDTIAWWETRRQAALHGDQARFKQRNMAHCCRSHLQQQIHILQHNTRQRVQVPCLCYEWYGLLQTIWITKMDCFLQKRYVKPFLSCGPWKGICMSDKLNAFAVLFCIWLWQSRQSRNKQEIHISALSNYDQNDKWQSAYKH